MSPTPRAGDDRNIGRIRSAARRAVRARIARSRACASPLCGDAGRWMVRRFRGGRIVVPAADVRRRLTVLLCGRRSGFVGVSLAQHFRPADGLSLRSPACAGLCRLVRRCLRRRPAVRLSVLCRAAARPGRDLCGRPLARPRHLRLCLCIHRHALPAGVRISDRGLALACAVLAGAGDLSLRTALSGRARVDVRRPAGADADARRRRAVRSGHSDLGRLARPARRAVPAHGRPIRSGDRGLRRRPHGRPIRISRGSWPLRRCMCSTSAS
jgi:hypothetical protein